MNGPHLTIQTTLAPADIYTDSRAHPPQGNNARLSATPHATRNVRLPRATPSGGQMSKSEDGLRCAVAGTECESPYLFSFLRLTDYGPQT